MTDVDRGQPTQRMLALREALRDSEIPIHAGGSHWYSLNPTVELFPQGCRPVVAISGESEVPTVEEIALINQVAQAKLRRSFAHSEIRGLFVGGANQVTLLKLPDGNWTFGRLYGPTWDTKRGPLDKIAPEL